VVRAEDDSGSGSGPCAGGNEEDNTVELSGTPTGSFVVVFSDDFEGGNQGWTFSLGSPAASTGDFVIGDPVATTDNSGAPCQPGDDHTADPGVNCMYTAENPSAGAGSDDVDAGEVISTSPTWDLSGYATVTLDLWRWFKNEDADDSGDYYILEANDGSGWVELEQIPDTVTNTNSWINAFFNLESYISLTSTVQIRFRVADGTSSGDLIELAVDDIVLTGFTGCTTGGGCSAPAGLNAPGTSDPSGDCGAGGVQVAWNQDAGDWGDGGSGTRTYDVLRDGADLVTGVAYGTTTYLDATAASGASYNYSIRYNNGCGDSAATGQTAGTDVDDTVGAMSAPGFSDDDACAQSGVTITFGTASGATAYDLYVDATTVLSDVTSPYFYDPGDESSHDYQVRGRNANCTGSWSAATSGADENNACDPPGEVGPGDAGMSTGITWGDTVTVDWPVQAEATAYFVYRGLLADLSDLLDGDTDFCTLYDGAVNQATDASDPAGEAGRCYYYIVTGYNVYGEGPAGTATAGARELNTSGLCP